MKSIKEVLVDTMYHLMSTRPIEKLTVDDIISEAGVARSTFYRYFRDKYELMYYCYEVCFDEMNHGINVELPEALNDNALAVLVRIYRFVGDRKSFFMNAFKSEGSESLERFIIDFWVKTEMRSIEKAFGKDYLTDEMKNCVIFNCAGQTYLAKKWVLDGMKESPEVMAECAYRYSPDILKDIHNRCI